MTEEQCANRAAALLDPGEFSDRVGEVAGKYGCVSLTFLTWLGREYGFGVADALVLLGYAEQHRFPLLPTLMAYLKHCYDRGYHRLPEPAPYYLPGASFWWAVR